MEILVLAGTLALIVLFFVGMFAVLTRASRRTRGHRDSSA
jgi:hypothetical protein